MFLCSLRYCLKCYFSKGGVLIYAEHCIYIYIYFFFKKFGDEDDKMFYCIRAPENIFETYRYLLKVSDACNWSCEQQGSIPQSTR